MTEQAIDQTKAEAFAGRMLGMLSESSLALMTSIGHQTGLFDTMAGMRPATSSEIADAAGLQERYVREWLGAMVTGRIVDYDPSDRTYRLTPEHAAFLTRQAGPDNIARLMQFIPLLADVETPVMDAFRNGGGVQYARYGRFQELMAENSGAVMDAALIDTIIPLVPELSERLRAGIDVADIGCGRGHAVNLMAQAFPRSRFVGYDFSDEAIEAARSEAQEMGLTNARFEMRDVSTLDESEAFDLITAFDAIHDQAHPARVLAGAASSLRRDGVFLMVDIRASSNVEENIELPWAPLLYTMSTMHCMTVSLALGGDGLGTAWGREKALEMLSGAGFSAVRVEEVESDPFNLYYGARKA